MPAASKFGFNSKNIVGVETTPPAPVTANVTVALDVPSSNLTYTITSNRPYGLFYYNIAGTQSNYFTDNVTAATVQMDVNGNAVIQKTINTFENFTANLQLKRNSTSNSFIAWSGNTSVVSGLQISTPTVSALSTVNFAITSNRLNAPIYWQINGAVDGDFLVGGNSQSTVTSVYDGGLTFSRKVFKFQDYNLNLVVKDSVTSNVLLTSSNVSLPANVTAAATKVGLNNVTFNISTNRPVSTGYYQIQGATNTTFTSNVINSSITTGLDGAATFSRTVNTLDDVYANVVFKANANGSALATSTTANLLANISISAANVIDTSNITYSISTERPNLPIYYRYNSPLSTDIDVPVANVRTIGTNGTFTQTANAISFNKFTVSMSLRKTADGANIVTGNIANLSPTANIMNMVFSNGSTTGNMTIDTNRSLINLYYVINGLSNTDFTNPALSGEQPINANGNAYIVRSLSNTSLTIKNVPSTFPTWPTKPTQAQMTTELLANFNNTTAQRKSFNVHIKANSIVGDTIAVSNTMGIYSSDYNSSAIRNTFGKIGSGSDKWRGAIATPSGNVVFIPTANSHFVIYNTNSNTVTSYNSGLPNNLFNHAAILGDDGFIYVATGNAFTGNNFVRFDENTGTVTNVKPANFSPNSYWSAVNLGNGVAFLIPVGNNPTIWDTANGTIYNLTSISLTSLEVLSGAHHPNGNVYFMPFNGNSIIRYNVSSQAFTRMPLSGFGGVSGVSGTQKFTSTVMGADQKIYGIPYDQTCNVVLVYDPAANTAFTTNYGVTTFTQDDKFHAGALGSDGRIYMAPYNSSQIVAINTDPNSAQYNTAANVNWGTGPYGSSYSWGVTQGKNNKLVFVPNQSQFIVVGTLPGQPDYNAVLSIYLNKTA